MNTQTMRPSDICNLHIAHAVIPLCGALGDIECEYAAACIVLALIQKGDAWDSVVSLREIHAAIHSASQTPEHAWLLNPMMARPDFLRLNQQGFVHPITASTNWRSTLVLTEKAVAAMTQHEVAA